MTPGKMSMADFLCYVRRQLIDARATLDTEDSHRTMTGLFYTLSMLDDATLHHGDTRYTAIIDDLINAIQHTRIAEFKVNIPSEDDIRRCENGD